MNAIRRFLGLFEDSPTYGRDSANLMTGFTVGTTALFLNGVVQILLLNVLFNLDQPPFRSVSEQLDFGQLLALILLGGATIFATVLIPLRLVTVFWEPRVGRYFDQIVLSGITPLRFVFGKATSQNLYLGLILFLLLPYFVLSLTFGGVNLGFFAAILFLLWLYCIAMALVTLWVSLYLNELLAAIIVATVAITLCVWGCFALPFQPFVMTPIPAILHPVHASHPHFGSDVDQSFLRVFTSCAACITGMISLSILALYLGPLYGIVRENSMFGEVVREGDSKRKRWIRFRFHIQRSSEIAFFYQNRSRRFLENEGLIRWGIGFGGLITFSITTSFLFVRWGKESIGIVNLTQYHAWFFEFHGLNLFIHGCGLFAAILLFSHAKNSTYLRLPFFRGKRIEVSKLDTISFLLFLLFSTASCIAIPLLFERNVAAPLGISVFPQHLERFPGQGFYVDLYRYAVESAVVISISGLVIYAFQRFACLMTWIRSATFVAINALYFFIVAFVPPVIAVLIVNVPEVGGFMQLADYAPMILMTSPYPVFVYLIQGQLGPRFPKNPSTVPFYVFHGLLLALMLRAIRRRSRKLRQAYLIEQEDEANS